MSGKIKLIDLHSGGAATNQYLKYNGEKWIPAAGGSGGGNVTDGAAAGQIPIWDGSDSYDPSDTPTDAGQVFYWSGSAWTLITAPTITGHVLTWNGSAWVASAAAAGTSNVGDGDVLGQIPSWDGSSAYTASSAPDGTGSILYWTGALW